MASLPTSNLYAWVAHVSGGNLNQRNVARVFLGAAGLIGMLACGPAVRGQAAPTQTAGTTRTYYVAADEVNWDYAPTGRDEAMGMPFDELQKGYTESGPHRIGRVYKKGDLSRVHGRIFFDAENARSRR